MAKKDVGVIIQFDDVDYTDEERDLLWGQFFMLLAETAQEIKEKKNAELRCKRHFAGALRPSEN